jgi:endo-1,4-beta-D-glucanase Y
MKNFKLFCEGKDRQLDWILDKINKFGESSLSSKEKEYLSGVIPNKTEDEHYNRYIIKLLNDLKNRDITEVIAKQFVEKFTTKEDLFDFILQLLRDGKLDILLNNEKIKNTDDE